MDQQWTATVHIFLNVPTTGSLVFLSEHISKTAMNTSISNYLQIEFSEFFLYWFYMFNLYYFVSQRLI